MTTSPVTINADVEGRVIPGAPEVPPSYSHGGLPADPPAVPNLRITLRVPLRCVGSPDRNGFVRVDITHMVSADDTVACEDALIEAEGL